MKDKHQILKVNRLQLNNFNISLTFLRIFAIRQNLKDVFVPENCRKITIYQSGFL